jgi:Xaa-Pro aminopeptidase
MEQRVQALREKMAEQGISALLISNPYNRRYISGFTGTAGYVVVTETEKLFFTDFRYIEQAGEQAPHFRIIKHEQKPILSIKAELERLKINRLGIEQNHIVHSQFLSFAEDLSPLELVGVEGLVEGLRLYKDDNEIKIMYEAAKIADSAYEHILSFVRPGLTEREVAIELEFFMRKQGAKQSSFDIIVASGYRSALPHGVASDKVIGSGEFVTLDFGALYQGYCSDLTRTFIVGPATDRHREIYQIVLDAQLNGLNLRKGMTGKEADALTRDLISKHGYGDQFGHSTGHGLGMEVHEAPSLAPRSETVLQPGMVVTVEPGIYIPGFGGVRIEDDVVIREEGIEILTRSSKDLVIID